MNGEYCADCVSETHLCPFHQKADIEYKKLNRGHCDKLRDPVYQDLLKKYNEGPYAQEPQQFGDE